MVVKYSSLREQTVLCVDDEPAVLSSIKRSLRHEPYNLVTTAEPSIALDYVENFNIALVIIDQRMPVMTGLELAKEIKERSRKTPVIILTGYLEDTFVSESIISNEVDQLFFKPWSDKELKETIRGFLRQQEV